MKLYVFPLVLQAHIHNIFAKVDIKRRRDLMQIYEKYTASTEDE